MPTLANRARIGCSGVVAYDGTHCNDTQPLAPVDAHSLRIPSVVSLDFTVPCAGSRYIGLAVLATLTLVFAMGIIPGGILYLYVSRGYRISTWVSRKATRHLLGLSIWRRLVTSLRRRHRHAAAATPYVRALAQTRVIVLRAQVLELRRRFELLCWARRYRATFEEVRRTKILHAAMVKVRKGLKHLKHRHGSIQKVAKRLRRKWVALQRRKRKSRKSVLERGKLVQDENTQHALRQASTMLDEVRRHYEFMFKVAVLSHRFGETEQLRNTRLLLRAMIHCTSMLIVESQGHLSAEEAIRITLSHFQNCSRVHEELGVLFFPYRDRHMYWEVVVLYRKVRSTATTECTDRVYALARYLDPQHASSRTP